MISKGYILRGFRCAYCSGRMKVTMVYESETSGLREFVHKCVKCGNGGCWSVASLMDGRLRRWYGGKL